MAAVTGSSSDGDGERRRAEEQKGGEGESVNRPAWFPPLPYLWAGGREWNQVVHSVAFVWPPDVACIAGQQWHTRGHTAQRIPRRSRGVGVRNEDCSNVPSRMG